MNEERRRVLDRLAEGKINADEAERLLNALSGGARAEQESGAFAGMHRWRRHLHRLHPDSHAGRRYVRIVIDQETADGRKERVRMKVPVRLLKAGISLSGLMPREVRERVQSALKAKGIDVDPFSLRGDDDEILAALADLEIDVGNKGEKIRIYTVAADDDARDADEDAERVVKEKTVRREFRPE
jgi:hypothetical protein